MVTSSPLTISLKACRSNNSMSEYIWTGKTLQFWFRSVWPFVRARGSLHLPLHSLSCTRLSPLNKESQRWSLPAWCSDCSLLQTRGWWALHYSNRSESAWEYAARQHSLDLFLLGSARQASFIKPLMAEQRRHVSCVGDGRNWTHAVRVKWLNPSFALAQLR